MSIPRNTGPGGVPAVLLTDRAPLPSGDGGCLRGGKLKPAAYLGGRSVQRHGSTRTSAGTELTFFLFSAMSTAPLTGQTRQPLVTSCHIWELSQQLPRTISGLCAASPSPRDWSANISLCLFFLVCILPGPE